jgi:beta-glucanase (GH16 family)
VLHIVALQQATNGLNYTSARLKTEGLFAVQYGRIEFRAQLPSGQGYWPALWMFPRDSVYGPWAASGELDVMENIGAETQIIYGNLAYGGPPPGEFHSMGPKYAFPTGTGADGFHTYLVEWTTNAISWFVDGQRYELQTNWFSVNGPYPAPFNEPFYILMNLAVGGNFPGNPDNTTVFPGQLLVDYVRVYEPSGSAPVRLSITQIVQSGTTLNLVGNGPANMTCYILSSTNISPPSTGWSAIATNQTGSSGTFTNNFPIQNPASFYRLEIP